MDLGGTWRAAVADDGLRRAFVDRGAADDGWETIEVPGHWRSHPAFATSDGPLLYRRRFEAAPPPTGSRAWLVLDGLFYQGDVWLDGVYLGDTEGYFGRHTFEVTDGLGAATEHVLGIEVTCARQQDLTAKRNITGVFQHSSWLDPDWNPGGIWRPVRLEHTGPVRARSLRVLCRDANPERAVIALRAELDSDQARTIRLRTRVGEHQEEAERRLAEGSNFVEWTLTVDRPALWWPHALGHQPLHDVVVELDVDGSVSHTLHRRTGIRSLEWKQWTLSVNGERLFLKGANQVPTRMALAEATPDELRSDVELAKNAGLDLLRIHGHISRPEVYEAADELGMLVWQDFPLQWGYARGIRKQAIRQAGAAVDLLGHHPSIVLWCGHNEPFPVDVEPGEPTPSRTFTRDLARAQRPTWNRTVLDTAVRRAFEKADGTRAVIAHSGVPPRPGSATTDSHLWFGWHQGHERDLASFARAMPGMVRFVSEFGAQAVPDTDDFMDAGRWPNLDWERLGHSHGLQVDVLARHVPPIDFVTYQGWKDATQAYQARLLKHHVETLRRLKYRPTGGFCQFALADGHPGVTWSVLDHARVPKPGYAALAAACRPVIVVADPLPDVVTPGQDLALAVHVVSDLRHPLLDATVTATLTWPSGSRTWHWSGPVPADDCVLVGTVDVAVPDEVGELTLMLALLAEDGDVTAANHDRTAISAV